MSTLEAARETDRRTDSDLRAIETEFPFEHLSAVAEVESWRKEVYRPIYHLHKWWAKRLGSVFRAAIIAAASPVKSSVMDLFYQPTKLPGLVVLDPFMGSGTTIGEAYKLGCRAIGRDINPVACRAVQTALGSLDRFEMDRLFKEIDHRVGSDIRDLYRSPGESGDTCDVLYYFWVKTVPCTECGEVVDLFSTFVFARHAYARANPDAQVICPECNSVSPARYDAQEVCCNECRTIFNPQQGWARRTTATCRSCGGEFGILDAIRAYGKPPAHRMYAKLVLRQDGTKAYLPTTRDDVDSFARARRRLARLKLPLPDVEIQDGHNTRQILNYGYRRWHHLFNERQLLGLGLLAGAIAELPPGNERNAFAMLFSGILEFNNMFASYKGEGTGAVRHMFSHHILKPERMPIEANIWGTPKSSGAFSTLYHSRIVRALDYKMSPFELEVERSNGKKKGRKVFGLSRPIEAKVLGRYPRNGLEANTVYLSCGDSAKLDVPDASVDLIVTDPPFYDNVHYSELADFFFVWQELYFRWFSKAARETTRHPNEVQDKDAGSFAGKLSRVFTECCRVLKDDGLLVFSYHHSREDGWISLANAVLEAGFSFVQAHPVKAEMSVASPKSSSKEPIDLDVLLVCRKREKDSRPCRTPEEALERAVESSRLRVVKLNRSRRLLSRNDVLVILLSQLLVNLTARRSASSSVAAFASLAPQANLIVDELWRAQHIDEHPSSDERGKAAQLELWTS